MITSFDNNEDKVYLLLKDDIGGSSVKSRARSRDRSRARLYVRSHGHRFYDHGVTKTLLSDR